MNGAVPAQTANFRQKLSTTKMSLSKTVLANLVDWKRFATLNHTLKVIKFHAYRKENQNYHGLTYIFTQ